jgi:hypothetical protein
MSRSPRSARTTRIALTAALLALIAIPAGAAPLSISDGTATVTADDAHGGLSNFVLGGLDHLFEAEYYFRTSGMTRELALTGTTSTLVSSVAATSPTEITVMGSATGFNFTVVYGLNGSGGLLSSLSIQNTSGGSLTIAVFSYYDFDVNNTTGGDSVSWNGFDMIQSQGSTVISVHPTQTPDIMQGANFSSIRTQLRDTGVDNLTATGIPASGGGDRTFAFQFNLVIPLGGGTTLVYAVPEPSTGALAAFGLIGLAWLGRDRRRRAQRSASPAR